MKHGTAGVADGMQHREETAMKGWVGGVSALLAGALFFLAFYLENFWVVFFGPAAVVTVCQFVALFATDWARNWKFFVWSDFVYYIIIGSVGGFLGAYLPALPNVLAYNARTTYESAVKELPTTIAALDEATRSVNDLERFLSLLDAKQMACTFSTQPMDLRRKGMDDHPNECEARVALTAMAIGQGRVRWLSSRRSQLKNVISQGPNASVPSIPEDWTFFFLYQIFPSLLLCGAALKVGKTTLALLTPAS